jgi:2-phospho-L-lactate guanylyltransferase
MRIYLTVVYERSRVRVIVPFDGAAPKTRLQSVMSPAERRAFASRMLADVLAAVRGAGGEPVVLVPEPIDLPGDGPVPTDIPVAVDDRSLSVAVNDALTEGSLPAAVVMADLPLVTDRSIRRLFAHDGDVVLAYGIGGGTNAIVVRDPAFSVDYHDGSYMDHLANAAAIDASVGEVDSLRLSLDVDEPDDLADLLVYGDGKAAQWLRDHGFVVGTDEGRGAIHRRTDASEVDDA